MTTTEWLSEKIWGPKLIVSEEILVLQKDWIAENSDAREEGVLRDEYLRRMKIAEDAHKEDEFNPAKLFELAESYAVMDPRDSRALKLLQRLTASGDMFYDKLRQGDCYQMLSRSLFLACRFEECLEALMKAHACYKENGNRKVRRSNNVGLLRVHAAMGDSRKAAERLEVALTQCEVKDDSMLLYMHAKSALEKTGVARDAEILDDIWYVFLDTHEEEKQQWENYKNMGDNVIRQCNPDDEQDDKTLAEKLSIFWPMLRRELMDNPIFVFCIYSGSACLALYIFLQVMTVLKG